MDWEAVFIVIFILALCAIPVTLYIDGSFDMGAGVKCQTQGFDGGYRLGVAFGDEICWNEVSEQELEYFRLE
jgi:hypothetical protein